MSYQIKLNNFEGPFDLLFHLIEKAEMDIYDIQIAEITNQYLEYISEIENLDLNNASEFIVMAATLLHIKSKMLLPKESKITDEISSDLEDPRAELVEKLLEYKKYKEAAKALRSMEEKYLNVMYKNAEIIDDIEEDKLFLNIKLEDIVNAFQNVVNRYIESRALYDRLEQQLIEEEFTVDDKIKDIRNMIKFQKNEIVFSQLFSKRAGKVEIIMTFLALLELIRLKEITVYQNSINDEIIIKGVKDEYGR